MVLSRKGICHVQIPFTVRKAYRYFVPFLLHYVLDVNVTSISLNIHLPVQLIIGIVP